MEFKGTRGEWFNDLPSSTRLEGLLTNACDVANEEGKYVATVYGNTPKICKANAKLIAAAPENILEHQNCKNLLKMILTTNQLKDGEFKKELIMQIRISEKAIEKALK